MSAEKLRALLAEARGVIDEGYDRGIPSIIQRIDAALAEPVVGCTACEQFRKDFAERWYECHDGSEQACCKSHE